MTAEVEAIKSVEKRGKLTSDYVTVGLAASLGVTTWSGFSKAKIAHVIHPFGGLALVGFSVWHAFLNRKRG